jgi:hypothetical protein
MTRRRLFAAALSAAAVAPASQAGILPGVVSRTPEAGNTRYTYAVVLPTDMQLRAGNYFTIYDFAGYVPGTESAPAGWSFRLANVGPTPPATDPVDDPAVANLSWRYTGETVAGGIGLGNFWAASIYADVTASYFTAQTQRISDGNADTNITTTQVPVGAQVPAGPTVPEPGTLLLAALGLPAAGLVGRRRGRS